MPSYPADYNDTVVYNGVDLYIPKDCSCTVFEDSRVFLFGEFYLNGQPIMTGSAISGTEVQVSPTQPTDGGIKLWFDTSAGYGELKVLQAGSWKTVEDPADSLAADEVSIGVGQPATSNYELWVDTSIAPENLKAKIAGSWKTINNDVVVSGTEPTDPNVDLWVDTATTAPAMTASYVSMGNALGIVAVGTFVAGSPLVLTPTTKTQVTNTLSVTLLQGRRYRVVFMVRAIGSTGAATGVSLTLRDGTTNWPSSVAVQSYVPTGTWQFISYEWMLDGDGISRSLNVTIDTSAGSNLNLYTDGPCYFHVQDVGPNPATIPPTIVPTPTVSTGNALGVVAVGTFVGSGPVINASSSLQFTNNLPVTLLIGRRYKVCIRVRASTANTVSTGTLALRDGTANVIGTSGNNPYVTFPVTGTAGYQNISYDWLINGDGTTKNLNVFLNNTGGGNVTLYLEEQSFFYVQDVGPNQYPALPVPDTPAPWTPFVFESGWANLGAGFQPCQYRKIGDIVYVRGIAKATTLSGDWAFTTLPAGFRSPSTLIYNTFGNDAPLRVDVNTNGRIIPSTAAAGSSGTWYSYVNLNFVFSTTP